MNLKPFTFDDITLPSECDMFATHAPWNPEDYSLENLTRVANQFRAEVQRGDAAFMAGLMLSGLRFIVNEHLPKDTIVVSPLLIEALNAEIAKNKEPKQC